MSDRTSNSQQEVEFRAWPGDAEMARRRFWQKEGVPNRLYVFDMVGGVLLQDWANRGGICFSKDPPQGWMHIEDLRLERWRPADVRLEPQPWGDAEPKTSAPIKVDDRVVCSAYSGGCFTEAMRPFVGKVGIVVETDDSTLPYCVQFEIDDPKSVSWWPQKAVRLASAAEAAAANTTLGLQSTDEQFRPDLPPLAIVQRHEELHGGRWEDRGPASSPFDVFFRVRGGALEARPVNEEGWVREPSGMWRVDSYRPVTNERVPIPWSTLETSHGTTMPATKEFAPAAAAPSYTTAQTSPLGPIVYKFTAIRGPVVMTATPANTIDSLKELTMNPTTPTTDNPNPEPTPKKSRNRRAIDAALFRSPVEWTLDQAHGFVTYLVDRDPDLAKMTPRERESVQGWVQKKLKSPYGKAALGLGLLAGNLAPLAASYMAQAESLVSEASDKMLEYAYTTAFKEIGNDFVSFIGKPGLRKLKTLYNGMVGGVERAERVRQLQSASRPLDFSAAAESPKACAKQD